MPDDHRRVKPNSDHQTSSAGKQQQQQQQRAHRLDRPVSAAQARNAAQRLLRNRALTVSGVLWEAARRLDIKIIPAKIALCDQSQQWRG
jgi:hypothetical protein